MSQERTVTQEQTVTQEEHATDPSQVSTGEQGSRAPEGASAPGAGGRARRSHRGWWIAGVAAVLVLVGVGVAASWSGGSVAADQPAESELPTATIERGTLTASEDRDGAVAYADASMLGAAVAGRVTWLPRTGRTLARGDALVRIDESPTIALYGSIPAYRPMSSGDSGRDVRQLEKNLSALGYEGFTVDDTYTDGTASAVRAWQEDVGRPVTGRVALGEVWFLPGKVQAGAMSAAVGDLVNPGAALYGISSPDRVIEVELSQDDRDLAVVDAPVTIDAGVSDLATGAVSSVTTLTTTSQSGQGGSTSSTSYLVTIELDAGEQGSAQAAAAEEIEQQADGSSVTVSFADRSAEDVLIVPIKALLALAEGGYGVEVVNDDGTSTIVAVTTGLFASGRVEVTGAGISEGDTVRTSR